MSAVVKARESWWKPGQSGNPAGRPKGARNKFEEEFLKDFLASWQEHGKAVIERVIEERPTDFLKVAATILPKHVENVGDSIDRGTVQRAIAVIESRILTGDAGDTASSGQGTSGPG